MNPVVVSRLLFGFSMLFHYALTTALPGLAIGLVILALAALFSKSGNYDKCISLIVKIYAVNFSIALISGLTLEIELHKNWGGGENVLSPLINHPLGRGSLFSFLFSTPLLFWSLIYTHRVPKLLQPGIFLILFIGSIMFGWWAIVVNSWMQTPSGVIISDYKGLLNITISDLNQFVFNPSFLFRFAHAYNASIVQGLLLLCAALAFTQNTSARGTDYKPPLMVLSFSAVFFLLLQPFIGHLQFNTINQYQPVKASAMEGYYNSAEPFHYYLWGVTDPLNGETHGIHLPTFAEKVVSLQVKKIDGLNTVAPADMPPVKTVFYAFHLMIILWIIIILSLLTELYNTITKKDSGSRSFYRYGTAFLGAMMAGTCGWIASETGRQPWVVYNLIRTVQASSYSPTLSADLLYAITNFLVPAFLLYLSWNLQKKILVGNGDYANNRL